MPFFRRRRWPGPSRPATATPRRIVRFGLVLLLIAIAWPLGATPPLPSSAALPANDRLGFVFVNGAGYNVPQSRYQQAVEAGAGWTRWPLYWPDIERTNGSFDYSAHDPVVDRDRANGLKINGILLNNPEWTNQRSPAGAQSDGRQPRIGDRWQPGLRASDVGVRANTVPGNLYQPVFDQNGNINPQNYWARFVYTTVSRYRGRVQAWELWNEPDWSGWFWTGTPAEYYRLLQVGYLAAKKADPNVTVLFGGLCHWCANNTTFFQDVARSMAGDPSARSNNFYFDVLPIHFYINPYYAQRFAEQHRATMAGLGFDKPIWINETNIPVCGDPERPLHNCPSTWRGTLEEQSNYIIQLAALAAALRIDRTLYFQFYDDGITDDSYGFIRNSGSPRPAYRAFQTAARYLNGYTGASLISTGEYDAVVLTGGTEGRVTVAWNKTDRTRTVTLPATTGQAQLVSKYGQTSPISASGGGYPVTLLPTTYVDGVTGERYLGGDPVLVVESSYAGPRARVRPLPAVTSGDSIRIEWELVNAAGGATFDVQFREGSGLWRDWLRDTSQMSATFGPTAPVSLQPGRNYGFRALARTAAGLQPPNGDQADAETSIPLSLAGCVRDNRGRAVSGARVTVGSAEATSDEHGRYRADVYPGGIYPAAAAHSGWGTFPARLLTLYYPIRHEFRLPPRDNAVQNAGFEGTGGVHEWWTPGDGVATETVTAHSGSQAARLGGADRVGVSRIGQDNLRLAAETTAPTYAYMFLVEGTPAPGDVLTATVRSDQGVRSRGHAIAATGEWQGDWIDLTGLISGTLNIEFSLEQRSGSTARVILDGVSVGSSSADSPAPVVGGGAFLPVIGRGGPRPNGAAGC